MKKTIYSILKGTYLVNAGAYKKWRLILFCSSLALIMIASSHSADGKVHHIAKLQEDVKALRSEYVEKKAQLMGLKMESNLRDIMKDIDLFPSHTPPIKIVITSNTDKP
jgi:hypothetical protein